MFKSALTGILALMALAASGSTASAGGYCDCDYYGGYGYRGYPPPARVYFYEPRVAYYQFGYRGDPRWGYAAYYAPPHYYAAISRGPAVLIHPYPPRHRAWRRW